MGLQDRDYYGEKYWELIEEKEKKIPKVERIYRPKEPKFWRIFNQLPKFWRIFNKLLIFVSGIILISFLFGKYLRKEIRSSAKIQTPGFSLEEKEIVGKIGVPIKIKDFEYTINWVKVFPVLVEKHQFFSEEEYVKYIPNSNFKFIVVHITAKNIGAEKKKPYGLLIAVKSKEGYLYEDREGERSDDKPSPSEIENYVCKWCDYSYSGGIYYDCRTPIYPEETVTGCAAIGMHQNREVKEIIFKLSDPGSICIEEEEYEKCMKEIERPIHIMVE